MGNFFSRRFFLSALGISALGFAVPSVAFSASPSLSSNFAPLTVKCGIFKLRTWFRQGTSDVLHVFIEGDGNVWNKYDEPSADPTPLNPVSSRLASDSPLPQSVLYIARPGQYAPLSELRALSSKWWTTHRYAREVADSMRICVDMYLKRSGCKLLGIYGHSGGGVLAALIAPEFAGSLSLLGTVASPLDTAYWAKKYNPYGLYGSLNPKDIAKDLAAIPQIHLTGAEDKIVPSSVLDSWLQELQPLPPAIRRIVVPGANHQGPWLYSWRIALAEAMLGKF